LTWSLLAPRGRASESHGRGGETLERSSRRTEALHCTTSELRVSRKRCPTIPNRGVIIQRRNTMCLSEFAVSMNEPAAQRTGSLCREASLSRAEEATGVWDGHLGVRKRIHVCKEEASRAWDGGRSGRDFVWRVKTTSRKHKKGPGCVAKSPHGTRNRFTGQRSELAAQGSAIRCMRIRTKELIGGSRCTEALPRPCEEPNIHTTLPSGVRERAQSTRRRFADTGNSLAVQHSGSGFLSVLPAVTSISPTPSMASTGATVSTSASMSIYRARLQSAGPSGGF
jgi:hypothetical protein